MFLVHTATARERSPIRALRPALTGILGGVLVVVALLTLCRVFGAHRAPAVLPLLAGCALLAHLFAHLWPIEYLLTDTHLRVKRGLLADRWIPLDQIHTVAPLPEGSEYSYHGFSAVGTPRPIVIVNPQLGDRVWVIFTPSEEFLRTLLWQIGRSSTDLDPLPEGPPLITLPRSGPEYEDDD